MLEYFTQQTNARPQPNPLQNPLIDTKTKQHIRENPTTNIADPCHYENFILRMERRCTPLCSCI